MDFSSHITKLVDAHVKAIAERKQALTMCAMVDKLPSLRWVEWQRDDGSVAHILISGGTGLGGRWVDGFRVEPPWMPLARENGFFL